MELDGQSKRSSRISLRLRWFIIVCLSGVILLGAGVWYFAATGGSSEVTFIDRQASIRLQYDDELLSGSLSKQDQKDKIVLRLTQDQNHAKSESPLRITVRYETGLRPITAVTKQNLRDVLLANVRKTYPTRFPGYEELNQRAFTIDSHDAAEVIFLYTSPTKDKIQQRFVLIVTNDDTAAYVSAQTKAGDFNTVNEAYFKRLFTSLHVL